MASATDRLVFRSQLLDRRARLESARGKHPEASSLTDLLAEVDAALERMDRGNYGLCETCHDPIETERLMADPLMRFCLDHLTPSQQTALEQDLDLAARIQTALLPLHELRTGGWEAGYHYEPAGAVSGDYCDLVATATGGLFFLTGDVSGKGVASSLLMSYLHAIFRSLLAVGFPIGDLLEKANRVFCESTLPSFYATLVCGHAHPGGEVEICNAGHCAPLLVSRDKISAIEAATLPLGLFSTGTYQARRIKLKPGDCLVLYTDGLSEARNNSGEEYESDRLTKVLRECPGLAPRELVNACLTDLRAFLGGSSKTDDLTLMVIRRAD